MNRPKCPKCGSIALEEERNPFTGRIEAVKCITCGERVYRDHPRRRPGPAEIMTGAHHKGPRP